MSFLWPAMLALLLLLPLLVGLYLRVQARHGVRATQHARRGGLYGQSGPGPGARKHLPPILFLLALALLTLAMARPVAAVSLPRLEGTVMLVFDVSGSMAADDLEPTRLAAAQAAAAAFVARQPPTVQIGVVAFSDGGLAVQQPTSDQAAILAAIERLRPERGTSIGEGLRVALNVLTPNGADREAEGAAEQAAAGVIVLLSDGENTAQPNPRDVALAAAEAGVRIYPVGVGTTNGTVLELDGFTVHTRLEAAALQEIAQLSDGAYFSAEERADLERIYDEVGAQLVISAEETELTALFAGAGMLLLLAGGLCSLFWFSRLP